MRHVLIKAEMVVIKVDLYFKKLIFVTQMYVLILNVLKNYSKFHKFLKSPLFNYYINRNQQ